MATVKKFRYSQLLNSYEFIRSIECANEKIDNIVSRIQSSKKDSYKYECTFDGYEKTPVEFYSNNANLFD